MKAGLWFWASVAVDGRLQQVTISLLLTVLLLLLLLLLMLLQPFTSSHIVMEHTQASFPSSIIDEGKKC